MVLAFCHNEIHHCEPFGSLLDAEERAVSLANEWYREDSIRSFGLDKITTVDEMREYYGSGFYFDSGDAVHVIVEPVTYSSGLKD